MEPAQQSAESQTVRNLLIGLVGGLILVAGVSFVYTRVAATDFKKLNDANWRTQSLGAPVIAFDSPVELEDISRPNNEKEREFIQYQMQYTYKEGRDLIIVASVINYLRHVYIDPNAPEQSVNALVQVYGATDITFESKSLMISNIPGKRIDGKMKIGDQGYLFARVNAESRNLVRDLLVIVKDGDPQAARFLDRMVSSVSMEEI